MTAEEIEAEIQAYRAEGAVRLVLDAESGNPGPEAASKRQKCDLIPPLVVFACRRHGPE